MPRPSEKWGVDTCMMLPKNRATNTFLALVALVAIFGSSRANVAAAPATRIVFKRGATEGVVHGELRSMKDELRFVVRAKAGQRMVLKIDVHVEGGEGAGSVHDEVTYPDRHKEGLSEDYYLPVDGDYRISLTEGRMGEEWQGAVTLHVQIK